MRTSGTERRVAIMQFLREYQQKHGYAPSILEIAVDQGISKTAVRRHLDVMQRAGLLTRDQGRSRSIVLVPQEQEAV